MRRKRRRKWPIPKYLGSKLLAIRKKLKLSQSQLLEVLNIKATRGRVSRWERGVSEPDIMILARYARLAGVSVEILMDDDLKLADWSPFHADTIGRVLSPLTPSSIDRKDLSRAVKLVVAELAKRS